MSKDVGKEIREIREIKEEKEGEASLKASATVSLKERVKPEILDMQAYQTKIIPDAVKLDANENPFPWTEAMKAQVMAQNTPFHRYPDGSADELKKAIANYTGVEPSGILTGNGGDELIQLILTTFGGQGRGLVLHPPTFSMYYAAAKLTGTEVFDVPLGDEGELDLSNMLDVGKRDDVGVILVCNPNNPTGNLYAREDILRLIKETGKIVVVDEAYVEFSQLSMLSELENYPNLIILRTFSKAFGMAGLRLGYLLGQPEAIELLNRARQPFNVNSFTQKAGVVALQYVDQFFAQVGTIKAEIEKIYQALNQIPGLKVYPTYSNFVLFKPEDADRWHDELLKRGFLVRNMGNLPVFGKCLRISAGRPEENEGLIKAIKDIDYRG